MRTSDWRSLLLRMILIALASVAPTVFPLSQMGYGSFHDLALVLILPAAVLLALTVVVMATWGHSSLPGLVLTGAIAGAVATVALEAVRYPGFRLGFMPGNLPQLMGVLLLDRFAQGPSPASNLVGFAYHFWNGASFGIVFALLAVGRSRWWAVPYGVAVGVGFLTSPVVLALGVGPFGRDFGWHFAATVLTAHVAFGLALAVLLCAPVGRTNVLCPSTVPDRLASSATR
jgi:hypothetical protein